MCRAFLIAGSDSVLVSLWEVDSKSTEALMVEFYRRLTSGEEAAAALRGAKQVLIERDRGKKAERAIAAGGGAPEQLHPYYWAAFVLIGS